MHIRGNRIEREVEICGLEVRLSGYRSRSPEFDSRLYQIF
jgi:hypothetical protein